MQIICLEGVGEVETEWVRVVVDKTKINTSIENCEILEHIAFIIEYERRW